MEKTQFNLVAELFSAISHRSLNGTPSPSPSPMTMLILIYCLLAMMTRTLSAWKGYENIDKRRFIVPWATRSAIFN